MSKSNSLLMPVVGAIKGKESILGEEDEGVGGGKRGGEGENCVRWRTDRRW